jgi:hypothetical protein
VTDETKTTPPVSQLEQRVAVLEQQCGNLNLTIHVMHRALLRCQARTWCLADQPRGLKAIWRGIKDLFVSQKKLVAEGSAMVKPESSKSAHLEPVPNDSQDKTE